MSRMLLIIDMQRFVESRIRHGVGYYPLDAIDNMRHVLSAFRSDNELVAHVIHQTDGENSPLSQYSPDYPAIAAFEHRAEEPVFIKNTSSAFASTALKEYIDQHGISEVVVIGAVAGFCVNSTVRHGADLGVKMTVVRDAVISFDLPAGKREEKTIHDVTMSLLEAGFARLSETARF